MHQRTYGQLAVTIEEDAAAVGRAAAADFAETVKGLLETKDEIAVIMATGNSQHSFRDAVLSRDDIDWARLTLLHVDEYLGVSPDRPESTTWRMHHDIVDRVNPKAFHAIRGDGDPAEEIARYSGLLEDLQPAVCILGVGQNGHMAFNDPPADFTSSELVIQVTLSEESKQQIVGEGRFAGPGEVVPTTALTLTVPALLGPEHILVIVPEQRKAEAIRAALEGPVAAACPASILQQTPHARMYLDQESSSLLEPRP